MEPVKKPRPVVPVLFRLAKSGEFSKQVNAVFPTLPGTNDPATATVYSHIGQHGTCSRGWYQTTRAAKPEEYADLLTELRGIYEEEPDDEWPVTLQVVQRWTKYHDKARKAELYRITS